MNRIYLIIISLLALAFSSNAQNNGWKEYFQNNELNITFQYTECHNPEKGLHHENVLLRLENKTAADLTVSYHLKRVYNGKEVKADVSDFNFTIPANAVLESSCNNLKEGLYIFSRNTDLKNNSILNLFELNTIVINGINIAK